MKKSKPQLVLYDISSTMSEPLSSWMPEALEDCYITIDLHIGMNDSDRSINYFYVKVATPEALRKRAKRFLISENRMIIIDRFDYKLLLESINNILKKCTR
ncbi:hypothetical protein OUR91_004085, partial [Escherichia coli]|nr:hypothetical protein [Escherichia coli]